MKVNVILVLTLLFGVCWAAKKSEEFVPWKSTTKSLTIDIMPYKIDTDSNFSNKTMEIISKVFRNPAKGLNVEYKAAKKESVYLLITSHKKCIENRLKNVCHPGGVVVVCIKTKTTERIADATKLALEIYKTMMKAEEEKQKQEKIKKKAKDMKKDSDEDVSDDQNEDEESEEEKPKKEETRKKVKDIKKDSSEDFSGDQDEDEESEEN
jgi:hypothetical protein